MLKKHTTLFIVAGLILTTLIIKSISLIQVSSIPYFSVNEVVNVANFTWSMYILSLLSASILFKGRNNKTALILWTLGFMLETLIWESMMYYYLIQGVQPYIMNWALPICMIPLVILVRYRIRFTTFFCTQLMRTNRFNKWAENTLSTLKMTRIELVFRWWIILMFTVDLFQAIYLTVYSILWNIPWDGSITAVIIENNHFDVFGFFYIIQLITNLAVIIGLLRYSFIDRNQPDKDNIKLSTDSKKRLIKAMHTLNNGILFKGKKEHGVNH
jgi:hypothetical protein